MTTGHKHRELRVRRDSLLTRLLTHPLVFSDDLDRVDRSPYPWGPIAGPSDPVPTMPDGQPVPKHLTWHTTPPGAWYLSALSVLHRWTGLTLRIPDDETDCGAEPPEKLPDAGRCVVRGEHDLHRDGKGYRWNDTRWWYTGPRVALCWCGDAHPVGEWHDPTHGQIDRDLQDKARTMLGLEPGVSHRTHAAITPTELNLQRRRDRGEL